jgi:hypothetical protein
MYYIYSSIHNIYAVVLKYRILIMEDFCLFVCLFVCLHSESLGGQRRDLVQLLL